MNQTTPKYVNDQLIVENLDFLEKDKEMAYIRSIAYKEKIKKYFNKQVWPRDFCEKDIIIRKANGLKNY